MTRVRAQYLTGCNRYGIQPPALTNEGKIPEWEWLDEDQLVLIKAKKVKLDVNFPGGTLPSNQLAPK